MRDPRDRFASIDSITAAAGVKIITPDLDGVLAGSPLISVDPERIDQIKASVESEIKQVMISSDVNGIILKADTLGSLEAIVEMLKTRNISIKRADIGPVTHRDVVEASAVKRTDRYRGVVLAFGVKTLPDAEREIFDSQVKIFSEQIIYNLIDNYLTWVNQEKEKELETGLQSLTPLCKFQFLKGFSFRRNDPAVFGVEILEGKLRQKCNVINEEGKLLGSIHQIQEEGKTINEAHKGMQVAVSMMGPTIGRQVNEEEILYTFPSESELKIIREKHLQDFSEETRDLYEEIVRVRRKSSPLYGY